jgi:protein arginine kinase activator
MTEISQNVKKELHVCETCAKEKGIAQTITFSLPDVLGKLIDSHLGKELKELSVIRCPRCKISYGEFRSKARLGCANDYEVFKSGLMPLLEKIHGSSQYKGKVPLSSDTQTRKENELIRLKRELDLLIKSENFERAAEVRDRIRLLESELRKAKSE